MLWVHWLDHLLHSPPLLVLWSVFTELHTGEWCNNHSARTLMNACTPVDQTPKRHMFYKMGTVAPGQESVLCILCTCNGSKRTLSHLMAHLPTLCSRCRCHTLQPPLGGPNHQRQLQTYQPLAQVPHLACKQSASEMVRM